jgi:hypothetical protein
VTGCGGTSGTGFRLQIPGRITTLFINLSISEPEDGGFKVALMRNGNRLVQVHFYGFMENVSVLYPCSFVKLMVISFAAGAGKSVIWCDNFQ